MQMIIIKDAAMQLIQFCEQKWKKNKIVCNVHQLQFIFHIEIIGLQEAILPEFSMLIIKIIRIYRDLIE